MRKSHWATGAAAVVLLAGTGVAFADWSSTGSASGTAATGTMTVTAAALSGETPASTLYPGGTADALVKLANPNGFSVQVVAITATGPAQAGNGCGPTGVTFTSPSGYADPQFSLAAGQSTVLRLTGALAMDTTSSNACQGQTFSLPVTVTVQK
ncbi:hypothetical protein [Amycolatopsis echigonensis]|uniref:Ribosomally synthesized peptide with SipW-like signal peptide n=1 Tax=Amycolatopsis echigonensis TaxID=2576905 RepID=A0A2N3WTI7_9PSEU|nr:MULTISPECIES: hypothetical protein [Amycolatopsis]MBB2499831.1 hypothetical protein [Amycolatopsis echigonensis]PKV97191.1 hypothetical protein ATK30_8163 [Amycolatopsis niigatensis]